MTTPDKTPNQFDRTPLRRTSSGFVIERKADFVAVAALVLSLGGLA